MGRCLLLLVCTSCRPPSKPESAPVGGDADSDAPVHTGGADSGGGDSGGGGGDSGGDEGGEGGEGGDSGGHTGTAPCVDDSLGEVPEDATWIVVDGNSTDLFSFDDDLGSFTANDGTHDWNEVVLYGANGFKLAHPGTVVGVSALWAGLSRTETLAATITLWPDFSSDGYAFDSENPYGTATRCVTWDDNGHWVDYLLPEPFRVDQPLHVYAGYVRDLSDEAAPNLAMENYYNEAEPFYSGLQMPDVDERYYYKGSRYPWYTWQVRLAVVYDEEIPSEDKPFAESAALAVSSRVAWGDYDDDGDDDVMTVGPTLYRNDGGSYTDVTASALPSGLNYAGGGVWGDYDNDGCLDYFGAGTSVTQGEVLLHNACDGTFTDALDASGINDLQTLRDCADTGVAEPSPTEGAAWFDLDQDGYLDLYLANYECPEYSDTTDPDYFGYYQDRLWRNNGDGSFTDYTDLFGLDLAPYAGRGVTTGDVDMDGWTDLFVSNYRLNPNFYYQNNSGTLTEIGADNGAQGTPHSRYGTWGHTIGSVFGDIDNDGDTDLISGNLAHPFYYNFSDKTEVLINDGAGMFEDEAEARGIYYRETHSNPTLFDADNDGDLDLFITAVYPERDSDLYLNDGTGHFTMYNAEGGVIVHNGWGAAVADPDQDGDQDLLAYALYENRSSTNGNHWLQVTAVGGMRGADTTLGRANRSAIGAVVQVTSGTVTQLRHVSGGSGTTSQDSLTQHFGLGGETAADEVRVLFPGGAEVVVDGVEADLHLWVCEDGRASTDGDPCE